ncbi:MAG: hypothetical protein WCH11_07400 [Bdellovibrio sp.]
MQKHLASLWFYFLLFSNQLLFFVSAEALAQLTGSSWSSSTSSSWTLSYLHERELPQALSLPKPAPQSKPPQIAEARDEASSLRWSSWSLSFGRSSAPTTDPFTGDYVSSSTQSLSAGLGFELSPRWDLDTNLTGSQTPVEKVSSLGFGGEVARRWSNAGTRAGVRIEVLDTNQDVPILRRRSPGGGPGPAGGRTEVSSENRVGQRGFGLFASQRLTDWMRFRIRGNLYQYDKNISEFLSSINSNYLRALALNGLANTLSSYPKSDASLGLSFSLGETWTLSETSAWNTQAADSAISISHSLQLSKDFERFGILSLGYRQSIFEGSTTPSQSLSYDLPL